MLSDQVVLLAVGVVGLQCCGRVEVRQEPRLPLGPGTIQYVLHQWRYLGTGPKAYRVGRWLRYDPAEVVAWVKRDVA